MLCLNRKAVLILWISGGQLPARKQPTKKRPALKTPVPPSTGTVVVTIGTSSSNAKVASVPAGYTCPLHVDKTNWLSRSLTIGAIGVATYGDRFEISQNGTALKVVRKDRNSGWPFELKFACSAGSRTTRPCVHDSFVAQNLVLGGLGNDYIGHNYISHVDVGGLLFKAW